MKNDGAKRIEGSGLRWQGMEVLDILSSAIYDEQSAHEFYSNLAGMIVNQEAQAIFEGLAEDEKRHRRLLEIRYQSASQGQSFLFDSARVKRVNLSVDSQMKAIDAVELALTAEKSASEMYRKAAEQAEDAEGRKMFESLAEDEDRHHEILMAEREALLGHPYWFTADEQRTME